MNKLTEEQCELITQAFEQHKLLIVQVARKFTSSKSSKVDFGELESYLNEKFMEAVLRYDSTKGVKLGAFLNSRLTQHAINFVKSAYQKQSNMTVTFSYIDGGKEDGESDEAPSFEETLLTDGLWLEEELVKQTEIKTAITEIYGSATEVQRSIMDVYLKAEVKPSYTQVGKAVGLHHETVKRELAKLARKHSFDFTVLSS